MSEGNGKTRLPGSEPPRVLPKRFYKAAGVEERDGQFHVVLDGRPIRTPKRNTVMVPTRALGEAIAAEWEAQAEHVDPARMPLTRYANTILDGIVGRETEISADIAKYAGTDLLCYRADAPQELVEAQAARWDPLLQWARSDLSMPLVATAGMMPVAQQADTLARAQAALGDLDAFQLAAVHTMTTLMGSVVLALAVLKGRLTAQDAWDAAHVDEDWQIRKWGADAEAAARRLRRWEEMQAAVRMLGLLGMSNAAN
jgi:chaperone required for assembly of F1-ATPase